MKRSKRTRSEKSKEGKMVSAVWAREEVIQVVTVDPLGSATPDPFRISKDRNQQVKWVAFDGKTPFTVEFKKDSPFYETQFSDKSPYSGIIRRSVLCDPAKTYEYTVRIAGRVKDPGGIVDP
jgi:hypothetical protein